MVARLLLCCVGLTKCSPYLINVTIRRKLTSIGPLSDQPTTVLPDSWPLLPRKDTQIIRREEVVGRSNRSHKQNISLSPENKKIFEQIMLLFLDEWIMRVYVSLYEYFWLLCARKSPALKGKITCNNLPLKNSQYHHISNIWCTFM